jgi:Icc protein
MNRADPFFERDGTDWQLVNLATGHMDLHYTLYDNRRRTVAFNPQTGRPEDREFRAEGARIPPQKHF